MAGTILFAIFLQMFATHIFAHREHKVGNIFFPP